MSEDARLTAEIERVLRVPMDYEVDPATGLNRGRAHADIAVHIDPSLDVLGRGNIPAFGPTSITLREPNEQVLLHELLHLILGCPGATEADPHGHRTISRVEVALWEAGYRLAPTDQTGGLPRDFHEDFGKFETSTRWNVRLSDGSIWFSRGVSEGVARVRTRSLPGSVVVNAIRVKIDGLTEWTEPLSRPADQGGA